MRTLPVILALSGCIFVDGSPPERDVDTIVFEGEIHEVEFDLDAGDLIVRVGDVETPVLERVWHYRGSRPDVTALQDGEMLLLDVKCPMGSCEIDHELILPSGADIWGTTGAGDVFAAGTGGIMDVETGAGDVHGSGLDARGARVETGAGDVRLEFAEKPDLVVIETGAGDVRLDVPAGRYDIHISTGAGSIFEDGVTDAPGSPSRIEVTTGAGDVILRGQ